MKTVTITKQLLGELAGKLAGKLAGTPGLAIEVWGRVNGDIVHVAALASPWRDLPLERVGVAASLGTPIAEGRALLRLDPEGLSPEWIEADSPARVLVVDLDEYAVRTRGIATAASVRGKTILLVGSGSIGSRVGWELSRLSGVRVVAADRDVVDVHTPARWFGPTLPVELLVGEAKAPAWAAGAAASSAPTSTVEGIRVSLMDDSGHAFARLLADVRPDVMVVSTDTRDTRVLAASLARELGIPTLFAGLSDGAESGMIQIQGASTPCWLCANRDELVRSQAALTDRSMQYGTESTAANETAGVPALSVNIALTAAVTAKLAVVLLAGEPWQPYFRDSAGRTGTVLALSACPESWIFSSFLQTVVFEVKPDPACAICGETGTGPSLSEQENEILQAQAVLAALMERS